MDNENVKNRRWRSSPEVKKELRQSPILESIREAASLRSFIRNALLTNGYRAAPEWEHIVALTPAGEEALRLAGVSPNSEVKRADISLATFSLFFHHELLVDCANCDLKTMQQLVNVELHSGRLQWPHRFGRVLYDKFNDSYSGDRTDHLLPDEALALTDGTAQGVYQVGQLVSGPLGLIEVSHSRYVPPSRSPVLWHCSDPSCQAAHGVKLLTVEVPIVQMIRDVGKALETHLGPASEWATALPDFLRADIPRQPYTYFDVCTLIADCIVGEERASLLSAAIGGGNGNFLRDVLGRPPRKKTAARGAPEAIAKGSQSRRTTSVVIPTKRCGLDLIDRPMR